MWCGVHGETTYDRLGFFVVRRFFSELNKVYYWMGPASSGWSVAGLPSAGLWISCKFWIPATARQAFLSASPQNLGKQSQKSAELTGNLQPRSLLIAALFLLAAINFLLHNRCLVAPLHRHVRWHRCIAIFMRRRDKIHFGTYRNCLNLGIQSWHCRCWRLLWVTGSTFCWATVWG